MVKGCRSKLIERISRAAADILSGRDLELALAYFDAIVSIYPDEQLLEWQDVDLLQVHLGLLNFAHRRTPDQSLVKVFNPDKTEDGWSCNHTVVYFCHRDVPFLVDSVRMALNRAGLGTFQFESRALEVSRDADGVLTGFGDIAGGGKKRRESHGFMLVDCQTAPDEQAHIQAELSRALSHVDTIVDDFTPMLARMDEVLAEYAESVQTPDSAENLAFLKWLRDGNFTFLGISEFRLDQSGDDPLMSETDERRLGLFKFRSPMKPQRLSQLTDGFADFYAADDDLAFAKSTQRSTVHRDTYPDYVIAKRRDASGRVIGETRFLGLYTARLYHLSIAQIPLVRAKANWLIEHSGLDPKSHDGKAYVALLEGHPRDELIQASVGELQSTTLGIWKIFERRTVRLFLRTERFRKFVSCIVYLPRESLRTELRERIQLILETAYGAESSEYTTQFLSESVLARIHVVLKLRDGAGLQPDPVNLEQKLVFAVQDWRDRFGEMAHRHFGDTDGLVLARRYRDAFPDAYKDAVSPAEAVADLARFRRLTDAHQVAMSFHELRTEDKATENMVRLKVFRRSGGIELSDMIPMLENLGFRVLSEHPYELTPENEDVVWVQDFHLRYADRGQGKLDYAVIRDRLEAAFHAIWQGRADNDGFNRLIAPAGLTWREVQLLRACARYLKQLGQPFAMDYVADVLGRYSAIAKQLVAFFTARFEPADLTALQREQIEVQLVANLRALLDGVDGINEDQVLRNYIDLMRAVVRTNFFAGQQAAADEDCLTLKVAVQRLAIAPSPKPLYEIFVFSPRIEGVHLRMGKVARGGIRWSDRLEDYRTEVLGLVKAQQVKNAVIVPDGAKGGFVAKRAAVLAGRDAVLKEGLACYRIFIRGLLSLTDNKIEGKVVTPPGIVARDEEDPYLVVAADKGTASYSDTANAISAEFGFWLDDAFASGGSQGYDHKKMGITARGAWVAVQRHFREIDIDVQRDPIEMIGIGDMSGDVFGNGLLRSDKVRLIAAFNHLHIFIDPNPDAAASFLERQRLFALPRSSWSDYNETLISAGGGVYSRKAKRIALSEQARLRLGIEAPEVGPDELIRKLLMTPVDLIWNGGIGTYVKATSERHTDVGDRSTESVRVNGADLQCKVFAEGGNLGMTQLGRIEYCQSGGRCNTDFVDNSGGVDCSDHEVNIKILLNDAVVAGHFNRDQRNELLREMTDAVAERVLANSYAQTLAISLAAARRQAHHFDYMKLLDYLDKNAGLDRALEFLPDDETLRERHAAGTCWTRPELAILVAYTKDNLQGRLIESGIARDPIFSPYAKSYFPVNEKFSAFVEGHQLYSEIVCTRLANELVNRGGLTLCYRLNESIGASLSKISIAYIAVKQIFRIDHWWQAIDGLDGRVKSSVQQDMYYELMRLTRRATRWFLRHLRGAIDADLVARMAAPMQALVLGSLAYQPEVIRTRHRERAAVLLEAQVPSDVAEAMAGLESWFLLSGVLVAADFDLPKAAARATLIFHLADKLGVDWLMTWLVDLKPQSRWQDLSREAWFFDLEVLLRRIAERLPTPKEGESHETLIDAWMQTKAPLVARFQAALAELRTLGGRDLSILTVAMTDLRELAETG